MGAGRLLSDQLPQIGVLAHPLGRGREVEDELCTVECQPRRGGRCHPEVLADFDAELGAVHRKGELRAEVGLLTRRRDALLLDAGPRGEPARLVEFGVVGDVALGHHAEQAPLGHNRRAVVEPVLVPQRKTDDECERQLARLAHNLAQRLVRRIEQRGLQEEVGAGVARDGQFGEGDQFDAPPCGLLRQRHDALGIARAVGHRNLRHRRRNLYKSVVVHRFQSWAPCAIRPTSGPD